MSKVGKPYKKTVELRQADDTEISTGTLITCTNPLNTEDFTLNRLDFLNGYGILNPTENTFPFRKDDRF